MLEIQINLLPGGSPIRRRTIQTIAIWNISDLAEVSDYEWAMSYPIPMGTNDNAYSALDVARNDHLRSAHGFIRAHARRRPVTDLVYKVLVASEVYPNEGECCGC